MVGIDVGATKITQSNRLNVLLGDDVPRDLLKRVADNRPHVVLTNGGLNLAAAEDIYASAVGDALRHQQLGNQDAAPVALAFPGWWSPRAAQRVEAALEAQQLNVFMVNDAEAAVAEFQQEGGPLPGTVAVVSLRAAQSSIVIVRNCGARPSAMPSPVLVHEEGGDSLDSAVLRHLLHSLVDIGNIVDVASPKAISAAPLALTQCQQVREALSQSATESIQLHMPGATRPVRLVRSELEEVARPWVDAVVRMVASAIDLCDERVEGILLTGGLASMPLTSQRLSADLALEVFVPNAPLLLAARGANRLLEGHAPPPRKRNMFRLKNFHFGRVKHASPPVVLTKPEHHQNAVDVDEFFTTAFTENDLPAETNVAGQSEIVSARS